MADADVIVQRLAGDKRLDLAEDYWAFVQEVDPLLRSVDRDLEVVDGRIEIRFARPPTAAALARALDETDRHARRVVAGFDRGVRPESLRGRGVRLVPPRRGLRVKRANPGSLDVVLVLGGLYQAITSQPLSFALNLGALMGYGRAALRAIRPNRRQTRSVITVQLPVMPLSDHEEYGGGGELESPDALPSLPGMAKVEIPSDYSTVHISMTSADGSTIEIDCE